MITCCFNIIQHLALIFDPDHLCFEQTIYDNKSGPGGTIYVIIIGPAGPLTVWRKILTGENIDEFDEFPTIRQYFPYQNFTFSHLPLMNLWRSGPK